MNWLARINPIFLFIVFALAWLILMLSECVHAQSLNGQVLRLTPTTLPATCNIGDLRTDANDAYSLKQCSAVNTWTVIAGGGGGDATSLQSIPISAATPNDEDVLTYNAGTGEWEPQAPSPGFLNPMTTQGDIIIGTSSGTPDRLGIGATNTLPISSGTALAYGLIGNANIGTSASIEFIKMQALTPSRVLTSDGSGYVGTSSTSATTLSYLDVSSSLTTLLAGKQPTGNYITALTGDISAEGPGSSVATLPTVNSNVGSFGSASNYTAFTVNAKGLVTAASAGAISIGQSQVTSLVSDLAAKQPLDSDLTAVAGIGTTGIMIRTGSGTATTRTLAAGSSKLALTNADGVSGNPTYDVTEANLTLNNIGGTLSVSKGGTGADNSAATGVQKYAAGTGSVATIVNADVSASAGIGVTKLQALPTIKSVVTDSSGFMKTMSIPGSAGINMLSGFNNDAEEGSTTYWSESGGGTLAVTSTAANVYNGSYSFSFDASANNDYALSDSRTIPAGLQGQNCWIDLPYKGFDSNITLQIYDGTNVIASQALTASTGWTHAQINFICPASGSLETRLRASADAAIGYYDEVHLGSALNIGTVTQATFYGGAEQTSATNCAYSQNTSSGLTNWIDLGTAPSCAQAWTSTGNCTAVGATSHQITCTNMPPGNYKFEVDGYIYASGSASSIPAFFQFSDGTDSFGFTSIATVSTNQLVASSIHGGKAYTTTATRTFKIQASDDGAGSSGIDNSTGGQKFTWRIYRYPSVSQTVVRAEDRNWRVDANISGANPDLGTTTDFTSYTGIEDAGLTLTNNTGSGVLTAQIPCSSTNAPSGTTCSAGSESVGVAFTAPTSGDVIACASFGHNLATSTGGAINVVFQLVETPVNAQTISQEGKSRISSALSTAGIAINHPLRVCGNFSFASAGQKVIRLMREQDVTTTILSNVLIGDASATVGQRDIHWEVYPINNGIAAPILVGSVTSNSSGAERVERVRVTGHATTPGYASQSGAWVTGTSRAGTGIYTINIASGIFASAPTCQCTCIHNALAVCQILSAPSSTDIQTACGNTTVGLEVDREITCMGPR